MRSLNMLGYRLYSFLNDTGTAKYKTVISNHTINNNGNKKREKEVTGELTITCTHM